MTATTGDYIKERQISLTLTTQLTVTDWRRVIPAFTSGLTNLWGAGGTGRWGPHGTLLDEIKPWWNRGKAEVLHRVAQLTSMGFPMLADR